MITKIDCSTNTCTNYYYLFLSPHSLRKEVYLHHLIVFFIALQLVHLVHIDKSFRAHVKKTLAVSVCELHHQNLFIAMCQFLGHATKR